MQAVSWVGDKLVKGVQKADEALVNVKALESVDNLDFLDPQLTSSEVCSPLWTVCS
jgi:hypothetical protein